MHFDSDAADFSMDFYRLSRHARRHYDDAKRATHDIYFWAGIAQALTLYRAAIFEGRHGHFRDDAGQLAAAAIAMLAQLARRREMCYISFSAFPSS